MAAAHASAAAGPAEVGVIKVAKAEGASGRTVAELWGQRAALNGKEVTVRGKVVKFTPEVMGKNWIHLRDGSGARGKDDDVNRVNDRTRIGIERCLVRRVAGRVHAARGVKHGANLKD